MVKKAWPHLGKVKISNLNIEILIADLDSSHILMF